MAWQLLALTLAVAVGPDAFDCMPHHMSLVQLTSDKYGKHECFALESDPFVLALRLASD